MRGAPQSGFSRLILRISLRISVDTGGRPHWPRRTFQVQNSRNPLRCQAMTVAGLTMRRAERHSAQAPQSQAHNHRSNRFSFGFFTERCSTPSWWRRARISSCNAARVRKTDSAEASNADNTAVGENSRKVRNSHCISQIPICEKHNQASFKKVWATTLRKAGIPYFRIYDLRSTYATRLSAGGVADEWVTQLLRQGDAKVFKKYSQMKLQMKREALAKLNRKANDKGSSGTGEAA